MSANLQPMSAAPDLRYRFGTFELNAQSRELRRNGTKIGLQDQPFLVLRKLLESAGTIVAREDLHAALWPADTFVDFDTSLNTAIKRLREVLGDSAETPVFIETVPRRGYRFLAPVQVIHNGASPVVRELRVSQSRGGRLRWGLLVSGLLLAGVIGGLIVAVRSPTPMPRVLDSTQLTFDGLAKGNLHLHGDKIYFNEIGSGDLVTLVQVPTVGGTPTLLASAYPELLLGDVSADGSKLLLDSAGKEMKGPRRLTSMDLALGSLQNLDGLECNDEAWAPGGKLVCARSGDVFLAEADGSNPHKLLSAQGQIFYMRFSPDGSRLRFTLATISAALATQETIWEARADGTGLHPVPMEIGDYPDRCCGEWSRDGRYYFFRTIRNGQNRIWALPEHQSFWDRIGWSKIGWRKAPAPVPLTTVPPNFYMGQPSEDGKKLFVTAAQPLAELARYDLRTRQFVPFLSGLSAGDVEGSPDGQLVTYVRYPELTLWRAKADGSEASQITGPTLRASLPHWSPDGKQIAFAATRPGKPWSLFLIAASGGPAEQITNASVSDLDPAWSPDGKQIAYGQTRIEGNKQTVSIQLLDLATRRSTSVAGTVGICCPRWSPDGRYLLGSHAEYDDLVLYELATGKSTTIVKNQGFIGYMEWADGGKDILFDTFDVPDPAFYRLRVSDLHLDTVVKLGDIRRFYAAFGPWTGMAPDGSPLLVRDISKEEIYALDLDLP